MTGWAGSVSYTHLDVYKRQVQGIVNGLVGGINEDMVVLHKGDCALRLQERMLIPRRSEVAGEDILGILDGLLRIAAMHALVRCV